MPHAVPPPGAAPWPASARTRPRWPPRPARGLAGGDVRAEGGDAVALLLELDTNAGRLSLLTTTTVFGTPAEVTLSELAIEAFQPADAATAARLARLMG